ncbi:nuclear pore complex protein NUP133 [Silene latifolia]|uniref:nuclear pore complex protein NUP133 n=1 Tax=Silene latifolia TaxID=37657 RepID=UPI003D779F65
MFSPATRKKNPNRPKTGTPAHHTTPSFDSSPFTPPVDNRRFLDDAATISNRPKTGTPAPWASRLSLRARIPTSKENAKVDDRNPVYVGDFPQVVYDQQTNFLHNSVPGEACIAGGMDKETSLSWMICGNKLFMWSYLSPAASKKCIALDIPLEVSEFSGRATYPGDTWLLSCINWNNDRPDSSITSAGVVLCNQKNRGIVFWPNVYDDSTPLISLASPEERQIISSPGNDRSPPSRLHSNNKRGSILVESGSFNSLIASAVPSSYHTCVALATSSSGELWQFSCSSSGIRRQRAYDRFLGSTANNECGQASVSKGYPRSLIWRFPSLLTGENNRQFLLLTDMEIQCFSIQLSSNMNVSKVWSQEIIGTDNDLGIKKDLAGQKRIWPLDVQVDEHGKEITILVAIFCKDRVSSSSYTQYSLLTMRYKAGVDETSANLKHERVLEKKAPVQVIIPKARVEEEEFLFSMRLRVGGKPSGSAVILSGDGTATVSYFWRNTTRLYQFDLPYDAGKVLDASVFPSSDDGEGAWVVMTEKAGIWAIREESVLFGGVEPPERSLSRKGSSNERSTEQEKKTFFAVGNISPVKASVESPNVAGKQRAGFTGVVSRSAQDEETEALLNRLFHDFLLSGTVDGSLEKLKNAGAFERDGETSSFARASKAIVDTLAKHWTTTRGAEIVALAAVSNQLTEKLQKHEKFLQFLALSKCHEELCIKQRHALQIILEHGEKLTGMIQLRELQNMISHNNSFGAGSQHLGMEREASGSLWDLIQLVGERARRNTVLLMDRDNSEVFYSKISDIEEVFYCLDKQAHCIINVGQPLKIQVQRACELSKACVTIIRSSMQYKNEHHIWYPPPDGLVPWYSQSVVRDGLWSVAAFMIQTLNESSPIDISSKSDICSNLEVLADVVLESYVGAITAKVEREEDHKGLSDDYRKKRDILLDSLYQQIKVFVNARYQDSVDENGELREVILRELSSNLLSVARRHEAYQTLWNICCDLNDSILLKELMHESMGPRGGYSYYVFEQLHKMKQFSKLLRLGEEFPQGLLKFLKDHQDLMWLHEIYLLQHSDASRTLHGLALSEDGHFVSAVDEETESASGKSELTLSDRKRFLQLSKIAAAAGKDNSYEEKIERIDADLKILKCQEDVLQLLPDEMETQHIGQRMLPPWELIRLCLQGRTPELLLKAFDVFAWTSSSFRKSNKSLLEECWKIAVDLDDWEKLYQFSIAEGWSEDDTLRVLEKTMLCQAGRRCYGPESDSYNGGFEDVLPVRQESFELSSVKDSGASSVEAVLMQHKDFSDAGKLMLTAVMLGSAEVDIDENEGAIPME